VTLSVREPQKTSRCPSLQRTVDRDPAEFSVRLTCTHSSPTPTDLAVQISRAAVRILQRPLSDSSNFLHLRLLVQQNQRMRMTRRSTARIATTTLRGCRHTPVIVPRAAGGSCSTKTFAARSFPITATSSVQAQRAALVSRPLSCRLLALFRGDLARGLWHRKSRSGIPTSAGFPPLQTDNMEASRRRASCQRIGDRGH